MTATGEANAAPFLDAAQHVRWCEELREIRDFGARPL
jgi:hypothetical protein